MCSWYFKCLKKLTYFKLLNWEGIFLLLRYVFHRFGGGRTLQVVSHTFTHFTQTTSPLSCRNPPYAHISPSKVPNLILILSPKIVLCQSLKITRGNVSEIYEYVCFCYQAVAWCRRKNTGLNSGDTGSRSGFVADKVYYLGQSNLSEP